MENHQPLDTEMAVLVNTEQQHFQTDSQNAQQQLSHKLSLQECKIMLIVTFLFMMEGAQLGFYLYYVPVLLSQQNISYSRLSMLSIIQYPFAFNVLFGPLLEKYYSQTFGKRKTYMVPLNYLLTIILCISSQKIQTIIEHQQIELIVLAGFVNISIVAILDICLQGFQIQELRQEIVGLGSISQQVGYQLGYLVGSYVLIFVTSNSSYKVVQSVFDTQFEFQAIIETRHFLLFQSLLILLANIYIHFACQEQKIVRTNKTVLELYKSLLGFFKNPNLLKLIIFVSTFKLGMSIGTSQTDVILIKKGFNKDVQSIISFFVNLVVNVVVPIVYFKTYRKGQEISKLVLFTRISSLLIVTAYLLITNCNNSTGFVILYTLNMVFQQTIQTLINISSISFMNQISELSIAGTFNSFILCFFNFGSSFADSILYMMLETIELETVVCICMAYQIFVCWYSLGQIMGFKELDKCEFRILNQK